MPGPKCVSICAGGVETGRLVTFRLATSRAGTCTSRSARLLTQRRKSPSDSAASRCPEESTQKITRALLAVIFSSARITGSSE